MTQLGEILASLIQEWGLDEFCEAAQDALDRECLGPESEGNSFQILILPDDYEIQYKIHVAVEEVS